MTAVVPCSSEMHTTREKLIAALGHLELDEFDEEDATHLVDVLLEAFTPLEVQVWICFPDVELDGTPLAMIEEGQGRQVMVRARKLVADVST